VDLTNLPSALDVGRFCARQARGARDLQECAVTYSKLFPTDLYDGGLFSSVAGVNASSAPWLSADQLRLTNRAALWAFALDRAIDDIAVSWDDVRRVMTGCLAVAAGDQDAETDDLTRLLATLREDLAAAGAAPRLYDLWLDVLGCTLDAMGREWEWNDRRRTSPETAPPTVEEYLANAQNLGLSFVYVSYWISTQGRSSLDRLDDLMASCLEAEQVVRLVNDLRTYERDVASGDLNVLHLGISPAEVQELAQTIADRAHRSLLTPAAKPDGLNVFLDRQIGFNMGFYSLIDYWGGT
jgi:Terpene synthase family 2, C-terminal metal binding